MNKQYKIFLFLISLPFIAYPQTNNIETAHSVFQIRFDKYLRSAYNINSAAATDHLPLFINNPLDHWTASKSKMLIDGIAFDQFPFSFNSPNLLPVNFPFVFGSRQEMNPGIKSFGSAPLGFIDANLDPDYPDSFAVKLRSYIGSETGDPLIHTFTKENLEQGNKNKLPLSGSFSASNRISDFGYRLSLGLSGSYSTGSVNDEIIFNKSNYYSGKQNRQASGSLGLKYFGEQGKEYSLSASGISYYGWDIPPFLASLVHFETYLYTIRASAKNITDGLSLFLINDGSVTEVHKGKGIPKTNFYLSKFTLLSKYENQADDINYELTSDINFNMAESRYAIDTLSVKFFKEKLGKLNYGINFSAFFFSVKNIRTRLGFRIDYSYIKKLTLSGNLEIEYRASENNMVSLNISSITAFPNLTELYGSFLVKDIIRRDTFFTNGNRNLLEERINHLGVEYKGAFNNFNINFELFGEKIESPIRQKTLKTMIAESGEIFRDAAYVNASHKKTVGTNLCLQYAFKDFIILSSYKLTENSGILYYPRHSVFSKIICLLPINSGIQLRFNCNSKTKWDEFIVPAENDYYKNQGSSGKLGGNVSFEFAYFQMWNRFYFFRNLVVGFTIQDIFNNKTRFLPIGNYIERTVIFSLSSEI